MNIIISISGKEPIYEQIFRQMKESILRGELPEGTPLPSIRQLAKDLGVSVITTKRAYDELERSGLIVSVVGKGSFVAPQDRVQLKALEVERIAAKLADIVAESKVIGLTLADLQVILVRLYGEVDDA
ncbi:MAG: GntR family transcriptional regulator [Hydrogenibacillus sp.]|nr:GntR family transcriptional regulator [Hydrogenibacillus sp.]